MSAPSGSKSWLDQWWPLLVILYGVMFVLILANWQPTT